MGAQPVGTNRYQGRTALVVGGGHGIGRACAVRVAGEGARVVLADLDVEAAREVVAALPGQGHRAVHVDVTDDASVRSAVAAAAADGSGGVLDALLHVAGGDAAHGPLEEIDDATWSQMLDLNLVGVVRTVRAALPALRRSTSTPGIVVVSSVNALRPLGSEPYSAAKAALGPVVTNLAAQLGPEGVRINVVAPGTVRTRVWDDQGGPDQLAGLYPLGRVGEPEDVAAAVAFLGSRDAAWITGVTLPVEGGLLCTVPAFFADGAARHDPGITRTDRQERP